MIELATALPVTLAIAPPAAAPLAAGTSDFALALAALLPAPIAAEETPLPGALPRQALAATGKPLPGDAGADEEPDTSGDDAPADDAAQTLAVAWLSPPPCDPQPLPPRIAAATPLTAPEPDAATAAMVPIARPHPTAPAIDGAPLPPDATLADSSGDLPAPPAPAAAPPSQPATLKSAAVPAPSHDARDITAMAPATAPADFGVPARLFQATRPAVTRAAVPMSTRPTLAPLPRAIASPVQASPAPYADTTQGVSQGSVSTSPVVAAAPARFNQAPVTGARPDKGTGGPALAEPRPPAIARFVNASDSAALASTDAATPVSQTTPSQSTGSQPFVMPARMPQAAATHPVPVQPQSTPGTAAAAIPVADATAVAAPVAAAVQYFGQNLTPPAERAAPRREALAAGIAALDPSALATAGTSMPPVAAPTSAQDGNLDMTDRGWPEQMIARIDALREAAPERRETRLSLSPEGLGKLDVQLRQDGDRLHVRFTAETPAARQLIADAQPSLGAAAESRGLKLGSASVELGQAGADSRQGQRNDHAPQPQPPAAPASARAAAPDATDSDARIA